LILNLALSSGGYFGYRSAKGIRVGQGAIQWVFDQSSTLQLNALDQDLETIVNPSSVESNSLNVTLAL
jgi:hypothetical protein